MFLDLLVGIKILVDNVLFDVGVFYIFVLKEEDC